MVGFNREVRRESGIRSRTGVSLLLLVTAAGVACSAGDTGDTGDTAQSAHPIIFEDVSQIEWESASNNEKEWASAVGLLMPTSKIDRNNPNGTPKNCPDKTQSSFACTAVLDTFEDFLCSDETWAEQSHIGPSCSAFMIKNEPGSPALFATSGHCITSQADCASQSVVLRWRRSLPDFPAGNPSVLEQHIYQCTNLVAHGGHADSVTTSPRDWAVFEVDRYVTGGGQTGGPLTAEREALTISAVGPVPGGAGTNIGFPVGLPIKVDPEVEMGGAVSARGAGTFYTFVDAMAGQSGSPILNAAGEVVGILGESKGPEKFGSETCSRQCFAPPGQFECEPLLGHASNDPHAFAAVAVNISQLPSQFRTSAEHVMILLDQTGSMTAATAGGRTRWDDAIDAASQWVQFDKLSAGLVERAYSIWTFRDDTVIGGDQNGLRQIWPASDSADCDDFDAGTGYCLLPRASSIEPAEYAALQDRLETIRESHRPVTGPNTPLAHSLCAGLEHLRTLGGVKRIIVESDGGENSTALADACFGNGSDPFGDWAVDLSLRELADWGMTLDSWQAKVVRRGTRLQQPILDAVASPLGLLDLFPFDLVWHVDTHFAVEPPAAAFSRGMAGAELEILPDQTAEPSAAFSLAAAGTPDIDPEELSLFQNLGQATPRATFAAYVFDPEQEFGVDHPIAGDVNNDGCVNSADLCWTQRADVWLHRAVEPNTLAIPADLDRDGWVNASDLALLTDGWGDGCTSPSPLPNLETAIAACHADYGRRWLSFEDPQRPWTRGGGTVTLSSTTEFVSNDLSALQVANCQYASINSPKFHTSELVAGNRITFDVRLPTQQQNPYWLGDAQLHISIPSAGLYNTWIGQRQFAGLALGTFHSLDFVLPQSVKTALAASHSGAQLHIAFNTGNCLAPLVIDNVRVRN